MNQPLKGNSENFWFDLQATKISKIVSLIKTADDRQIRPDLKINSNSWYIRSHE